ncbi:unnamed protein product [Leptidea sinapis]|uniref:Uncharacterized protein n=1 Tax=Leptidea sinapis TaxID=189913 RepID=A0A5E4PSQ6_9NEOP|nr:unnamed protein product [Leptidea sinapis]
MTGQLKTKSHITEGFDKIYDAFIGMLAGDNTASSNPSSLSHFTFSSVPANPITLQPLIFAICPTRLPTAPAAPDTATVSPDLGLHISRNAKYAVAPGIPTAPRASDAESP